MTKNRNAILFCCCSLLCFMAMGCAPAPPTPDVEAKAIIKAALDSWSLGGSDSKFVETHKNVERFFDIDWLSKKVLLRYEIKGVQKSELSHGGYDVIVVLVFQSKAGTEITEQRRYHAFQDNISEDRWDINAN